MSHFILACGASISHAVIGEAQRKSCTAIKKSVLQGTVLLEIGMSSFMIQNLPMKSVLSADIGRRQQNPQAIIHF
jgi:hypothetical protein